jgi:hypothetical protein
MEFRLASDQDIETVLKHPEIWGRVSSDITVPADEWAINRFGLYLGGYVDDDVVAVMVFHEVADKVGQCHIHTLPEVRKQYASQFAEGAFEWYWTYFDHDSLIAEIPTLYPDVIGFAKKFGFKEVGVGRTQFLKSGQLYDKVVLKLERVA